MEVGKDGIVEWKKHDGSEVVLGDNKLMEKSLVWWLNGSEGNVV